MYSKMKVSFVYIIILLNRMRLPIFTHRPETALHKLLVPMNTLRFIFIFSFSLFISSAFGQTAKSKIPDKQFELHAYQAALQNYLTLHKADPSSLHVSKRIGACYYYINQPLEAIQWLQKVSPTKDVDAESLFMLGQAYRMTGQYQEAMNIFRLCADIDPVPARHFENAISWAIANKPGKSVYQVRPELINSKASEFGVAMMGEKLVFNSFSTDVENAPPGWVSGDTYHYTYSSRSDANGFLIPPVLLKKELRFTPNDGPVAFSPNGREVVFMRTQFSGNNRLTLEAGFQSSLFIADVNNSGQWENIRPFPHNGSGFSCAWPSFNDDGTSLLFSSDRPDGFGGMDIYMCQLINKEWSDPVNLGSAVNTPGHEITPLSADNVLYFASDWHYGYGGFDIFKAIKYNTNFISTYNMGPEINSSGDDLGLVFSVVPTKGYFVSNRKGNSDLDIFQFTTSMHSWPLQIRDAVLDKPVIGAVLQLSTCGGGSLVSDKQGMVQITMTELPPCKIAVSHPDYASTNIDARLLGLADDLYTVNLRPLSWQMPMDIVDLQSQQPLVDSRLRVTDQKTGLYQDYVTDDLGHLDIALAPQSIYFFNVTRDGYKHIGRTVNTAINPEKSLLGVWEMESSSATPVQRGQQKELVLNSDTKSSLEAGKSPAGQTAYAIQVAAIKSQSDADVRQFESLARFGTVYQKVDSTTIRVRIGLFEDRNEAERIAREVEKMGYPGAFVVSEKAETLLDKVMLSMAKTKPEVPVSSGQYMIRLAAYKNPKWFEAGELIKFGRIGEEVSGEWIVKYVQGILSLTKAREAVAWAKQNGFPEAYIIHEKDNVRQKIE